MRAEIYFNTLEQAVRSHDKKKLKSALKRCKWKHSSEDLDKPHPLLIQALAADREWFAEQVYCEDSGIGPLLTELYRDDFAQAIRAGNLERFNDIIELNMFMVDDPELKQILFDHPEFFAPQLDGFSNEFACEFREYRFRKAMEGERPEEAFEHYKDLVDHRNDRAMMLLKCKTFAQFLLASGFKFDLRRERNGRIYTPIEPMFRSGITCHNVPPDLLIRLGARLTENIAVDYLASWDKHHTVARLDELIKNGARVPEFKTFGDLVKRMPDSEDHDVRSILAVWEYLGDQRPTKRRKCE